MHGDSTPESGRRDITSTQHPWMLPEGTPGTPYPRRRGSRQQLRCRWGEAYRITWRWWRRPGRQWTGTRRSDGREVAARTPEGLLRALTADYVAEIAAEHHARLAREAAPREAVLPLPPDDGFVSPAMMTLLDLRSPMPRPYAAERAGDETWWSW